jgi:arylsulfotransferase ASST
MRRFVVIAIVCALGAVALIFARAGSEPSGAAVQARSAATLTHGAAQSRRLTCRLRARRYRTLPDVRPAPFCVAARRGAKVHADAILVSPRPDPRRNPGEQFGLMLVSSRGKLLWYMPRPAKVHDLKPVTYAGRPMLAYFERTDGGFYQLLDEHYRPVARIRATGGPTDEHELRVAGDGTAYVGSDPAVRGGRLYDYVAQRVDVATGAVRWQWRALDHVALRDSFEARPHGVPWDYFHGNAIDPPVADDPTVMISARNTSSLYGIDPETGQTRWILGGKRDQFGLARHPQWVFCTQHDARRLPGHRLLLFDNGGAHIAADPRCPLHPARALLFRMDVKRKRIRLLHSWSSVGLAKSGGGLLSGWVGSAAPLAGGAMLVDWGQVPRVSELSLAGRENLLLRLKYWSYRAAPAHWVGRPDGPPAMLARRSGHRVSVWASWNGATEIRRWQVLAGAAPDALAPVGAPVPFADLETRMVVRTDQSYVAVRAVAADGSVLGESKPAHVSADRGS